MPFISPLPRRAIVTAASMAFLLLAACGDNPYGSATVRATAVKVTPQVITFAAVAQTQQITATVVPANATDKAIHWESTDPAIASVDANGLVTAKAAGSGVFVTAFTHDGNFQASVNVSVNP
jgi:alpha-L-fucosidase 2